jgi:hypothetical protein
MRIGFMLLFMFVTGAGALVAANATEQAWPLFLIFPAYGVAPLLATRGTHGTHKAGEVAESN